MVTMAAKQHADLGDVQRTLFMPLWARAAESRRAHPALRDPKAMEIVDSVDVDAAYAANWGARHRALRGRASAGRPRRARSG
jgi:O-methyltransferase involved in polyketide biosynthesis